MFRIGQKVVCIRSAIPVPECPYPIFKKDDVYTVARFEEEDGEVFIAVEELHPLVTGHVSGFRPIVDRKTDISVFQEILRKVSSPSPVDAEIGVG